MTSVLVVVRSLGLGGTERHLLAVLPRLAAEGFTPAVACLHGDGALMPAFAAAGIEVLTAPRRFGPLSALLWLRTLYRIRKPDLIHFFLPEAYVLGGLAALGHPAPRLMSRRSLNLYQTRHPLAARVEHWLHRHMHALLGNSQAVLTDLAREGVPEDRLHLIRNGLIFQAGTDHGAARARLGVPEDALVMAIVANLIPYKGHADLLNALGRIRADLPAGWLLLCAGRDDGIGASLAAQAAALDLQPHVRFLGLRNDVPDILAAADIAISASHEEGSSNAVLEAMASSCPVIATRAGGNAEAVRDGDTGLLVPPGDPAALAGAILILANDSVLRGRMGAAGRRLADTDYSLGACVNAYAALYRTLLARYGATA